MTCFEVSRSLAIALDDFGVTNAEITGERQRSPVDGIVKRRPVLYPEPPLEQSPTNYGHAIY